MKDSGIEWIGEIPEDWEVKPLKYVANHLESGGTPESNNEQYYSDNGIPWVIIADMKTETILDTQKKLTEEGLKSKKLKVFPPKTLLYAMYASVGKVAELGIHAAVNQAILAISVNSCLASVKYLKFCLNAFEKYVIAESNGNTQFNLNANKVENFYFAFPVLRVQQKLADYLDKKCAAVDRLMENQRLQIEKLKEYKQSLITEAVSKGLDKTVPLKSSGVEWMGDIPEGWKVLRIKNLGTLQNGISKSGEFFGRGFPFVSYGDVYKNIELPHDVLGLIESSNDERIKYSVQKDDIFFTRTSETIEEVGFSCVCMQTINNATFAGFLIRLRPFNKKLLSSFAKFYFRGGHIRNYLVKEMNIVTRASLSQDLLSAMQVLIPPISEQQQIAEYLDKKCAEIDELISIKQKKIEKLTEYKKSLIYEYVTGKKEVVS